MTNALLPEGSDAPAFELPRDGGGAVSLSSLSGQYVVLYFYPRDDTPGCTTQALDFTSRADAFAALNAVVLGVSKDSVQKHEKFAAKHGLTVALLSDHDSDTCETYGVFGEKKMYGKTFMGITRTTYLIGPDGKILRVWPKVKVEGHAEDVLSAIREHCA
ncbi:thioredoxin-dependent thiol peroxidase [Aliiroseovarius sp. PTFE2010]|uniref:thioredoxin-dependent thiol peroxidase n=1 Tax=Aliiroseovarius sp. PTFE2010 TaxID=3417190 RepID=UPI003CFA1A4F